MDSGLALRAPRNDGGLLLRRRRAVLRQHLVVVLTELWRVGARIWAFAVEHDGKADDVEPGAGQVAQQIGRLELLGLRKLRNIVDRAAWHAGLFQPRHPLRAAARL